MARPTKLTPELQETILRYLRHGSYVETASAAAGINKSTFYDWLRRASRERARLRQPGSRECAAEVPFLEFSNAVEKAQAIAEIRDLEIIALAAQPEMMEDPANPGHMIPRPGGKLGDWHASAWRLERKFPGRYGRRKAVGFVEGGIGDGDRDTAKAARERLESYLAGVAARRGRE